MPAITIEGVDYDVLLEGARKDKPRRIGTETEAFSGKLRRTTRDEFNGWHFFLGPMSIAQHNALQTSAAAGKRTITGDLVGGASFECFVELGETRFDDDEATGIFCVTEVTIRQAD